MPDAFAVASCEPSHPGSEPRGGHYENLVSAAESAAGRIELKAFQIKAGAADRKMPDAVAAHKSVSCLKLGRMKTNLLMMIARVRRIGK